jgi:hypothetical protein
MKFSEFFKTNKLLIEGFNIGDTMEGVFAIAIALQIAFGKVTPSILNEYRRKVDISGTKETIIDSNVGNNKMFNGLRVDPGDKVAVAVKMKMKANNVSGMFGHDIKHHSLVDNHIETIANKMHELRAIDKIQDYMRKILTNRKTDEVIFYVIADGVEASGGRGEIKGDVKINIHARTNTRIPMDLEDPISFSLKVEDNTIANLGIFSGILKLGQLFNLRLIEGLEDVKTFPDRYSGMQTILYDHQGQWDNEEHLIYYLRKYLEIQDHYLAVPDSEYEGGKKERQALQATDELDAQERLINQFIREFSEQLEGKDSDTFNADPRSRVFASKCLQFLRKEMFGSDLSDVISIRKGDIKEIRDADFDDFKQEYVVNFVLNGITMEFYAVGINNERFLLFKIRPRLEYSVKGNRKTQILSVEVGDLT